MSKEHESEDDLRRWAGLAFAAAQRGAAGKAKKPRAKKPGAKTPPR